MRKKIISMVVALLVIAMNTQLAYALSPVAEVYYNVGTSSYNSSDFEIQLNDAVKAKLTAAGVNPKYVSIMDASADAATVTDETYVHSGYDSWYGGTNPEVVTADYNHVQVSNNGKALTFYGYTAPGYKDYMLTDGSPSGKKIITFDMDESKVNYHSMEGGGFLFNTKIDSDGKLSGYAILYVSGGVEVYQIDSVDANELHNETQSGLAEMQGVSQIGSYAKGASTQHTIKIVATDTTLNMWDNGVLTINKLSLPMNYGNEFGPIVSYLGHGCQIISIFSFDNMKLFSTSSKTLDTAAKDILWEPLTPLRYVVNINDDPSVLLDGGSNEAELKNVLNGSGAQYVGVTSSTYEEREETFIGSITQGGLHINSDESSADIIDRIADSIVDKIIGEYKAAILAIETAEGNTNISYKSGDTKIAVKNNLILEQDNNVTTIWSSDQPSVIAPDGTVTRPVIDQPGTYVTLKATITQGGLTSEQTFTVYVIAADPAPLSTLSATAGNGQITLNFPALKVASSEDIVVKQSTDGINFTPVNPVGTLNAASTSATITGLTNGTTYYFRLAVASGPYTGLSNIVESTPSEPLTSLSADAGNGQVTLKFPALTGASDIIVEQSTDGVTFAPVNPAPTLNAASTSATITGLTNGTTYYFRLTVESGKYAGLSNVVESAPSEPLTTLSAVAGNQQVTLNFPALTGASNIVVEQSADGTTFAPVNPAQALNAASTSATISGLTNGTIYYFRLAVSAGPHAGLSNVVESAPSEPLTTLSAVAGNEQVTLKFPALTGASKIIVEQSTDGVTFIPASPAEALNAASTNAIVSGLTNDKTYYFRLTVESGPHAGKSNVVSAKPSIPSVYAVNPTTMKTEVIVSDPADGGKVVQEKITKLVGENLTVSGKIKSANGEELNLPNIVMNKDGSFTLPKVAPGQYVLSLNVIAPGGEKLAGPTGKLIVDSQGNAKLSLDLVDPYGTILDEITGQPVAGVKMQLYWADTELNRSQGRVPGTLVNLPNLPDFTPNLNHNPQVSSDSGEYGWMVYPDGDYYFLAEKNGYTLFDSRTDKREESFGDKSYIKDGIIHVGETIVKFSFSAEPKLKATGTHSAYMVGYPDGSFQPDRGIVRSEVAAILSRLYTSTSSSNKVSYSDVGEKYWAANAIAVATNNKWMVGSGNNTFKPKEQITRAEFAQLLMNVYKWNVSKESKYTDIAGHWAKDAIATVESQGLLFNFTGKTFNPNQPITRLEVVQIFNQLLERKPWDVKVESKWTDIPKDYKNYFDIMEASIPHTFNQFETGIEDWKN